MNLSRTLLLLSVLSISGQVVFAQSRPVAATPPLPKFHSPVEYFRKLLEATPTEREEMLKDRSEAKRGVISVKISEYIILPPPVREWRLKATELRWYLMPLIRREPGQRGDLLKMIPDEDRPLVESRLMQWDGLPAQERKGMLDSQIALGYLARPPMVPVRSSTSQSDPKLRRNEIAVANWRRIPREKQDSITSQFNSFFTLSGSEKQKTIALFTGSEQLKLQKTVRSFEGMSDDARRQCLNAMQKIAQMSGDERSMFLKNAERWNSISASERRQWRTLIAKVPPLPPGFAPPVPHRESR